MLRNAWVGMISLALLGCPAAEDGGGLGADGGTGGEPCVTNQQAACECPDGTASVQLCGAQGTFDACQCGTDESSEGGQMTEGHDGSGGADDSGSGGAEGGQTCGNGVEDPGECDDDACPEDCDSSDESGGCAGQPIYAGMIPSVSSQWSVGAVMGFAAGGMMCQSMGWDHVCDYDELLAAEQNGDFAGVAAGTTAWIHRTAPAMVDGVLSQPGPGGRCVDWTYPTNHISDGEYVEFAVAGTPTYHLDNDTFYDGLDTTHTIPDALQCGGQTRAIFCCHAACEENPAS